MAGRVAGKVASITGAARGQGRSHAVRLAQEGADIIAIDACRPVGSGPEVPPPTPDDLAETADLVKGQDRRIVTTEVDVRDYDVLKAAVDSGVEQLGRVNPIHPTNVNTPMFMNERAMMLFRPDVENPTLEDVVPVAQLMHVLPVGWVEPIDISNGVLFLATDEARYITGVNLPVDAGSMLK